MVSFIVWDRDRMNYVKCCLWISLRVSYSLPLRVKVVIDLLVSDGHHDDEDPEEDDADQELVDDPHGDHRVLKVLRTLSSGDDALQQVISWHLGRRVHLTCKYEYQMEIEISDKAAIWKQCLSSEREHDMREWIVIYWVEWGIVGSGKKCSDNKTLIDPWYLLFLQIINTIRGELFWCPGAGHWDTVLCWAAHLVVHAGGVVHRLHPAPGDGADVNLLLALGQSGQAPAVIRKVGNFVVVRVAAKGLKLEKTWENMRRKYLSGLRVCPLPTAQSES